MKSLSFDNMAGIYDGTRVFDKGCFDSALDLLTERLPPDKYGDLLYPGIGTGRVAIPLAERGYRITGLDISENMLNLLRERLKHSEKSLAVFFQKADVLESPFPDSSFDMAITVHLFYFIPWWQKAVDEIFRVLKDGSPLILMHTGTGMEVPEINERYREMCAGQGYPIPDIGVKSNLAVVDYCESLGHKTEWFRDRWQWVQPVRLGEALYFLKNRAYSFTTFAPDYIHSKAIEALEAELTARYGSIGTEIEIPNQVYLAVIR